jgi:very-short-patch-repair endonuclease
VAFARTLRRASTPAEQSLWRLLRDRRFGAFKFRRQVPIGPFVADFACFQARLIIEADGGQHCESKADVRRDAWFAAHDFRVLRFWNAQILQQPHDVADAIYAALANPSPRSPVASRPSPARGEGKEEK